VKRLLIRACGRRSIRPARHAENRFASALLDQNGAPSLTPLLSHSLPPPVDIPKENETMMPHAPIS
jgi:hypothetical protein